jgi:large-conductance mechanosensitive channel
MSFITRAEWLQDFQVFLRDSNIVSMGLGFLVAQSTLDMSKSFVGSVIMPLITAIRTLKTPKFPVSNFVASIITFFITLLVTFIIIKLFRLQAKPIQPVLVANSQTPLV